MINVNVFQYSREIEVVCQDGNGTTTMNTYLGNMPMYDGHHKLHKGIDNTLRFKKPTSFYADSLRKQTQIASASPYTTGYNPGSSVMGGAAGINRAMTLSGLDPNAIASRYDAIGDSGASRWAGLDPNSVQTTNSLYGTSDYNAFNY